MFYKDFQGSSRFTEKVQYKAVYHRLTPSEINAGKVKLCKFRNLRHVKFSPPVDATATCESSLHKHSKEDAKLLAVNSKRLLACQVKLLADKNGKKASERCPKATPLTGQKNGVN